MLTRTALLLLALLPASAAVRADECFTITVVDEETGRGVPLVELRTVNNIRRYTDSNGIVAFNEPGLMGQRVFFHIKSHGYEYREDGFGYRGAALDVIPGASARLEIKRINIAERLYRVTGAGIYRDTVLAGLRPPLQRPLLNALVLGSDSVVNTVYRGKLYWFWGDTNRPAYPLGNFHVPGATSLLPSDGGLDPEVGVDLDYFVDDEGFAKETARMPGEGPTWINGLVTLPGGDGRERMFAAYVKVRGFLEVYERGLVEFDEQGQRFEKVTQFDLDAPALPHGHPFKRVADGVEYVYFADPYPLTRVRANPEHLARPSSYESFTCLKRGTRVEQAELDRAEDGMPRYGWKRATGAVGPAQQAKLIAAGKLRAEEALLHLQDCDTGEPVLAHRGSVYWNEYRRRWVMIAVQSGGSSALGEVWYSEADTPLGPWVYARKIVTHDKYSFYNPKQHPMFDKQGGRIIFFEGTYTHTFSGNPDQTPRYDYNQIMYKLDLADMRLVLPVPVYSLSDEGGPERLGTVRHLGAARKAGAIAFFALDRPKPGSVPVYAWQDEAGGTALAVNRSSVPGRREPQPLFHALPPEAKDPPATAAPLYEFVAEGGTRRAYSTDRSRALAGYRRSPKAVCLVWRNPIGLAIPWD
ncbi:MAG: hypothetical protein ACE5R4_03230 [Armatimonadota bacterium]